MQSELYARLAKARQTMPKISADNVVSTGKYQ
jgi:hypothetical protein